MALCQEPHWLRCAHLTPAGAPATRMVEEESELHFRDLVDFPVVALCHFLLVTTMVFFKVLDIQCLTVPQWSCACFPRKSNPNLCYLDTCCGPGAYMACPLTLTQ